MTLPLAVVMQLAAACAPAVAPQTIAAIALTESGFAPLALGDNTTGQSYAPTSLAEALHLAADLGAHGHSLDLGLMQINTANLPGLGLSIEETFQPCRSIAAGGRILTSAYKGGANADEQQAELRVALSRYNTGNSQRGFLNGYVRRVEASASYLIPALRVNATPEPARPESTLPSPGPTQPPVTPASDGEWHAGRAGESAAGDGQGEWHASPAAPRPISFAASLPASPASAVVLTRQSGSQ